MKRYFTLFPILAGLGLITLAGLLIFRPSIPTEKESGLPGSIADIPLTSSLQGEQALIELVQMHGKEFPLADGWIGNYGSRQATLWVAASADRTSSDRLFESMHDKIAMGNTPFTPVGERKEGDRRIYELYGMGQKHFYFQSGRLLVWLAANEEIAEQAFRETLIFYP